MRIIASTLVLGLAFPATAMADPILERQELMDERRTLMRVLGPIAQGEQDFDADAVLQALEAMSANAAEVSERIDELWAQGTETGHDTESAPSIWEDFDGYRELTEQFAGNTASAAEAAPGDLDEFRAVFQPVASSCGACHEDYRL